MRTHLYSLLFLLLATAYATEQLSAQCERVGQVTSVTPGCGVKLVDLDNGLSFRAVAGSAGLTGGQVFTFDAGPGNLPAGCPSDGLPVISLHCVSAKLPCVAQFVSLPNTQQLLTYKFVAHIYDETTQNCHWDFGDGFSTSGAQVMHTFPYPGEFEVSLTVTDAFGCTAKKQATVKAAETDYFQCGWDILVTAVGTNLEAKMFPITSDPDLVVSAVRWYSNKSSQILSEQVAFDTPLPDYGNYTVCAEYTVLDMSSGDVCQATRCQTITVAESTCINPALADETSPCPSATQLYAPVCGCDGITYPNECTALSAGLSQWWAGDCSTVFGNCQTKFETKVLNSTPDGGFLAQFCNLSTGNFTFAQLDFGDGSPLWEGVNWDTVLHHYDRPGIYKTNFTVWNSNACLSSVTQLLITDALSMDAEALPLATDYVLPGDANRDYKANVYDLLNLGVGHYSTGAPRPDANINWNPQFAPNWDNYLEQKVNYKHLDCDGNGSINEFDADVIGKHYVAIDTSAVEVLPGKPTLRLEFSQDTIIVDPNNPAPVEITADIKVGSPSQPALGLYGLAFALRYPDYVNHNPDADYDDDFFGSTNHLLWLSKDLHNRSQLDIGLTRKNGLPANGYGRVANVSFSTDVIIIIDVISRGEEKPVPFVVPIRGIRAIDKNGNPFEISIPAQQDTIWIKTLPVTGTNEQILQSKVLLSPNPAADYVEVHTTDLNVRAIEAMNSLGQAVFNFQPNDQNRSRLDLSGWPVGIYTLRIRTDEGVVEKKIVKK